MDLPSRSTVRLIDSLFIACVEKKKVFFYYEFLSIACPFSGTSGSYWCSPSLSMPVTICPESQSVLLR